MTGTKYCRPCDRDLPRDSFGDNVRRYDQKQSQCLECRAAKAKAFRKMSKVKL